MIPKAINVIDAESIGCNTFSVDQNTNNNREITIKRHSLGFTGPNWFNSFLINAFPPSIDSRSGGITLIIIK